MDSFLWVWWYGGNPRRVWLSSCLIISGGDFLCLGLTLFRGFVIILREGNQILLLCMLRFNPFPRGLSWCSSLLFGVTLQRYSVGWWWGIFFFCLGLTRVCLLCYNMGASEEHFLLGSFRVFLPVVMTPCGVRLCEVCWSLRWLYVDRPPDCLSMVRGLTCFLKGET